MDDEYNVQINQIKKKAPFQCLQADAENLFGLIELNMKLRISNVNKWIGTWNWTNILLDTLSDRILESNENDIRSNNIDYCCGIEFGRLPRKNYGVAILEQKQKRNRSLNV